jgi:AcrR family transcriptional regulator/DNA-binding XRE family transcriptional regulator
MVALSVDTDTDESDGALGTRIRDLRLSRRMSLRELARRISASPSLISQIENGKTRLTVVRLRAIAQALGVREQNLFSDGPLVAASSAATTHLLTAEVDPAGDAEWRRYEPLQLDPVLTATLASILETGYHGSSVRDIAARCGLSVPGLYHYYPSKQAMLVALLDLTMTDLLRRSRGAIAEGQDSVERFSQLVECLALYHSHRQQLAFVGASEMRSLEPASRRRIAAMRMEQQAMVDREVEAAVEQGRFASRRPHEASRAVVTMCTAIAQWFQPRGPLTPEQIAEHYVEFALDLMRVTTAG